MKAMFLLIAGGVLFTGVFLGGCIVGGALVYSVEEYDKKRETQQKKERYAYTKVFKREAEE